MEIKREQLEAYKSKKEEIEELKYKLEHLDEEEALIGRSTVLDYRSGYPVPQTVVGIDWEMHKQQKERCEKRIRILRKQCEAIEKYVEEDIEDSLIRRIFRMYYLEGRTQKEIAKCIHMDRSTVSRKLNAPAQ